MIFRANIWNLGYNGQFLLGAALVSGYGPSLVGDLPLPLGDAAPLPDGGRGLGRCWTLVPALLKARYGTNEIITTLMMSFIGVDLASLLIKGPFQDPTTSAAADERDRRSRRCCPASRARASTSACSSRSRRSSSSTTC